MNTKPQTHFDRFRQHQQYDAGLKFAPWVDAGKAAYDRRLFQRVGLRPVERVAEVERTRTLPARELIGK